MSEENVKSLHRALDAFNRRDRAAWLAVCDPECENVPPREWPESAPIQGAQAIWDFFVESQDAWEGGSFEWGELIDAENGLIVANQRRQMRGKSSDAGVVWSYWVLFTFHDGKVIRFEWFADRADALKAAGLQE
jgi:ketosteroid isomerase-like protein